MLNILWYGMIITIIPFNDRELKILEWRRVQVLSVKGLVLCFHPCLCAHKIGNFRLKTTSCTFFILAFLSCFPGRNSWHDCNDDVHGWNAWQRRCLNNFWSVEVQNSTFFLFWQVTDNEFCTCITYHRELHSTHVDCDQASKLILVFVLKQRSKAHY